MQVKLIIICVIFGSLTFGCRNLLSKYESDVTTEVTAHSWRRTVVVEQLETKTAETWGKLNEGQKIKCKIDLNKTLSDWEF